MPSDQSQPDEIDAAPIIDATPIAEESAKALSRLKRELSEEELFSPGVLKMLVEDRERIVDENRDLQSFRAKFYIADKELAILKQKLKNWSSMEVLSTGCIALGAAAFVYAPEAWKNQPDGYVALAFGAVLTLVGIAAKAIRL
jgi:hypothetical protein